jgi:hypothetical protein
MDMVVNITQPDGRKFLLFISSSSLDENCSLSPAHYLKNVSIGSGLLGTE